MLNYYLKVLEYISTEVDSSKFVIDETARSNARNQIVKQQFEVLGFLDVEAERLFKLVGVNGGNVIECF